MQQLSLFRGVHDTQPRPVTLEELVTMMRTDQSVRDLTEKHRYARATGDEQGASRYKKMMTSFGVAALFVGGRRQQHIVELTGLSLVDIDHIPAERMSEVLALVRGDEHTLLAYTTLSGQGVRILFRYQINDNGNVNCHPEGLSTSTLSSSLYKTAFLHGNAYYEALTGLPTDGQCKNVGRISTIAYDEELYYNPEATPFIIEPEEKKSVGRPKGGKSEKLRVKSCKVKDVEAIIIRELARRGVVYAAGTYNKYVNAACYEMNRYGVPEEQCREWAVNRFADYDTPAVEAIVRSCYQQTEEHGTAKLPRQRQSNQATVADIQRFLTDSGVRVRYNVITRKREVASPNPSQGGELAESAMSESPLLGRGRGEASYFSIQELTASATALREGIDNRPSKCAYHLLHVLVEQLLDPIREAWGEPIVVSSGYRCKELNMLVGGVKNSHHMLGCAADIIAGNRADHRRLFKLIQQMQQSGQIRFTQLIWEGDGRWIHISYVPGDLRCQVIE